LKQLIDVKNEAVTSMYSVAMSLCEERLPQDVVDRFASALAGLNMAVESENVENIKPTTSAAYIASTNDD